MTAQKNQHLYTCEEVAPMFRIAVVTLRRWAREGRISSCRVGKSWLFSEENIEECEKQCVLKREASA